MNKLIWTKLKRDDVVQPGDFWSYGNPAGKPTIGWMSNYIFSMTPDTHGKKVQKALFQMGKKIVDIGVYRPTGLLIGKQPKSLRKEIKVAPDTARSIYMDL